MGRIKNRTVHFRNKKFWKKITGTICLGRNIRESIDAMISFFDYFYANSVN